MLMSRYIIWLLYLRVILCILKTHFGFFCEFNEIFGISKRENII